MDPTRKKSKGRKIEPLVGIPRMVVESFAFRNLSGNAVKLLMNLYVQYKGFNNGDLSAPFSTMQRMNGWKSKGTLSRAIKELIEAGLIEVSRQGGRHKCSLYAVTFKPIDDCKGKLDIKATTAPVNLWKKHDTLPSIEALQRQKAEREKKQLMEQILSVMEKSPAPY